MSTEFILNYLSKALIGMKIYGFYPVTFEKGKSVTKFTDVLFSLAALTLGAFIIYYVFLNKNEVLTSSSDIANLGNFVTFISSIVISMISLVMSFIFRHELWKIIVTIVSVQDKVLLFKIEIIHTELFVSILFNFIFNFS